MLTDFVFLPFPLVYKLGSTIISYIVSCNVEICVCRIAVENNRIVILCRSLYAFIVYGYRNKRESVVRASIFLFARCTGYEVHNAIDFRRASIGMVMPGEYAGNACFFGSRREILIIELTVCLLGIRIICRNMDCKYFPRACALGGVLNKPIQRCLHYFTIKSITYGCDIYLSVFHRVISGCLIYRNTEYCACSVCIDIAECLMVTDNMKNICI